jgi:GT2 family glycosyltransferase
MRAASGKYVITMDDDAFIEDYAIFEMVNIFEKFPKLAVMSFNCLNYYLEYDSENPKSFKKSFNDEELSSSYDLFTESCAGFRRSVLVDVGFHQYEYFYGWEDTELGMRILANGYNIKIMPNLIAYHKITNTYRDTTALRSNSVRNTFWMIVQYIPIEKLFFHLLRYHWYLSLAIIQEKKWFFIRSWVEALLSFGIMVKRRNALPVSIFEKLIFPYTRVFLE